MDNENIKVQETIDEIAQEDTQPKEDKQEIKSAIRIGILFALFIIVIGALCFKAGFEYEKGICNKYIKDTFGSVNNQFMSPEEEHDFWAGLNLSDNISDVDIS